VAQRSIRTARGALDPGSLAKEADSSSSSLSYLLLMDFPPMDWGAFFPFNPAALQPRPVDPTGTPLTGYASGLEGFPGGQHTSGMQLSDADAISKIGVCSNCRKYGLFLITRLVYVTNILDF
jgi:hypothetical protein